jgi:rubrerythrin
MEEPMIPYSLNEIVEFAVQIEHDGYAFYNEAIKHKGLDTKALNLLTLLRDQELEHEKTFLALRDNEDIKNVVLSGDWEVVAAYLKYIVEARIFDDENSAIQLAIRAKDAKNVVEYAIQFEKDTLLFFHTIKDVITIPKAQDALAKIIQEEISHVLKLTEFKAQMA